MKSRNLRVILVDRMMQEPVKAQMKNKNLRVTLVDKMM